MEIKSIAVIVSTNTGNEDRFKRCIESLEIAQLRANPELKVEYFTLKDSPREEILKRNIKEIRECDLVTFVNDNDYVGIDFFDIPSEFRGDEVFAFDSCYGFGLAEKAANIDSEEDLIHLDCHLWGYFFPAWIIESLTEGLINPPRPEISYLDDFCYWSWILLNPTFKIRFVKLYKPHYYHEG